MAKKKNKKAKEQKINTAELLKEEKIEKAEVIKESEKEMEEVKEEVKKVSEETSDEKEEEIVEENKEEKAELENQEIETVEANEEVKVDKDEVVIENKEEASEDDEQKENEQEENCEEKNKEEKNLIKRKKKYQRIKYNKKSLLILLVITFVVVAAFVYYKYVDKKHTGLTNVKNVISLDSKEIIEKENIKLEPGQTIKVSRDEFTSGIVGFHSQSGAELSDTKFELNVDIIFRYGKRKYKALVKAEIENSNYDTEYEVQIIEEVDKIDSLYELGFKVLNDDTTGIVSIDYKEAEETRSGMVVNYNGENYYILFDGNFNITIEIATQEQLDMPNLQG